MEKFWVFVDREIHGPYDIPTLWQSAGFSEKTKVCREGSDEWADAKTFLSIMNYARGLSDGRGETGPSTGKHKNWRDAVIQVGFETVAPKAMSHAGVSAFMLEIPAVARSAPRKSRAFVPRFFKDRRDKSLLMVLLWLVAVQVYSSHWGDASMLYQSLSVGPVQEYAPVRNYSTHPNRGHVKFYSRRRVNQQAIEAPETVIKSQLIDESTEDLGNDMMMKVSVVMTEKSGVKTYQTRRQYFQLSGRRWKPI